MAYFLVHRSSMKGGGANIPSDCSIFFQFCVFHYCYSGYIRSCV